MSISWFFQPFRVHTSGRENEFASINTWKWLCGAPTYMNPLRLTCILELLCVPCTFLNRLSCCPLSVCFCTICVPNSMRKHVYFLRSYPSPYIDCIPRIPNANFSSTRCCVIVHIGEHFPALMCVFIRSYLWPPILGAFFVTIYSCTVSNHPLVLSSLPKNYLKKNLSMSEHSLEVTFLSFKLIQQRLHGCITYTKKKVLI